MTCKLPIKCSLCQPSRIRCRDVRGRFVSREDGAWTYPKWFLEAEKSPYSVDGNLAYEIQNPGKTSHTPHIEFCPGCLERVGLPRAGPTGAGRGVRTSPAPLSQEIVNTL